MVEPTTYCGPQRHTAGRRSKSARRGNWLLTFYLFLDTARRLTKSKCDAAIRIICFLMEYLDTSIGIFARVGILVPQSGRGLPV